MSDILRRAKVEEIASPLDRVMMKIFKLRLPIGFGGFWLRAFWFSALFAGVFTAMVYGTLKFLLNIDLFAVVPPGVLLGCFALMMCFGFPVAYVERKALLKKYGSLK